MTMSAMTMKVTTCSSLRARKSSVLLHPVGGHVALAGGVLDGAADGRGAVKIVHLEADDGEQVRLAEEALRVAEAHEGLGRVVLVEAGVEDAGHAEALVLGREAERRQLALRTGDQHAVAHLGADLLGEFVAEDQGRIGRVGRALVNRLIRVLVCSLGIEVFRRSGGDGVEQTADRPLLGRNDAFDERESGARPARNQHLAVDSRRRGGHVWHRAQTVEQRLPVADAVGLNAHQIHVRRGSQQPVLKVAPHAVGDGQGDDQRGHARGHPGDGDAGDHAHHGLPPLGLQVP